MNAYTLRRGLGQLNPFIAPTLPNAASTPTAPAASGGSALVALAGTLLYAGLGVTSTLFSYGVAKESRSKTVKTTGYILAGVSALGTLAALVGGTAMAAMSGNRR
jgi:hypothetical protein